MKGEIGERLWVLTAPPGVSSSGPDIVTESYLRAFDYEDRSLRSLIAKGWEVDGPYVRQQDEPIPLKETNP